MVPRVFKYLAKRVRRYFARYVEIFPFSSTLIHDRSDYVSSSLPRLVMDAEPSRRTLTLIALMPYIGRAIRRYCSRMEMAKIRHEVPGRVFIEGC